MIGYVEAPRAWWLTHGAARSVGVSLPNAVIEGWLTRRELAQIVDRCQSCGSVRECEARLADPHHAPNLPDFCCNKTEIEALRD